MLHSTDKLTDYGKVRFDRCMERALNHFKHSQPRQNHSHAILYEMVDIYQHEVKNEEQISTPISSATQPYSPQSLLDIVDGKSPPSQTSNDLTELEKQEFIKRIKIIKTPENEKFIKRLKESDRDFLTDNDDNKDPSRKQWNWLGQIEKRIVERKRFDKTDGFGPKA